LPKAASGVRPMEGGGDSLFRIDSTLIDELVDGAWPLGTGETGERATSLAQVEAVALPVPPTNHPGVINNHLVPRQLAPAPQAMHAFPVHRPMPPPVAAPEPLREQDRLLPLANVARLMGTELHPTAKIARDAKVLMQEMVSEFLCFMTSEANDLSLAKGHKAITPDDIIHAFENLDLAFFAPVLESCARQSPKAASRTLQQATDGPHRQTKPFGQDQEDETEPYPDADQVDGFANARAAIPTGATSVPLAMGTAEQMVAMLPLTDVPRFTACNDSFASAAPTALSRSSSATSVSLASSKDASFTSLKDERAERTQSLDPQSNANNYSIAHPSQNPSLVATSVHVNGEQRAVAGMAWPSPTTSLVSQFGGMTAHFSPPPTLASLPVARVPSLTKTNSLLGASNPQHYGMALPMQAPQTQLKEVGHGPWVDNQPPRNGRDLPAVHKPPSTLSGLIIDGANEHRETKQQLAGYVAGKEHAFKRRENRSKGWAPPPPR